MNIDKVLAFRGKVANTPELEAQIRACLAGGGGKAGLVRLAAEHGYSFTEQDIEAAFANDNDELSDFELEMVSAGGAQCVNGLNDK